VDNELEGMWQEATVTQYTFVAWNLTAGAGQLSGGPRFEIRTSQM